MSKDAKEGGDLFEMAKDGTTVPGDAGKQNILPSVPNPDQKYRDTSGGLGAGSLSSAADNPVGSAKNVDNDAVTATGHSVPPSTAAKPSRSGGKEREPERFQTLKLLIYPSSTKSFYHHYTLHTSQIKATAAAIALVTLFAAASATRTNQYASWEDCHNNKDRTHTSGQDVILKGSTHTIFTNEDFHVFAEHNNIGCTGGSLGSFPKGDCINIGDAFKNSKVTCLKLLVG
ncbi:hypothetical protein GGR53DRAFT_469744 [Hypoxylon sp. FL1150]|nr:hypothetical protein GGR53DRAFT_469744 [Hypoxylon sp. FL1150]